MKLHAVTVQSRFAETLTINPNPNFGESDFGKSGGHRSHIDMFLVTAISHHYLR